MRLVAAEIKDTLPEIAKKRGTKKAIKKAGLFWYRN
jgi:hypothetical protein